jgi:hypothetical protein
MNLTTDQLIFLAGIIQQMTEKSREADGVVIEGKFNIRLEWSTKRDGRGEYILRGVQEENVTRG